MIIPTTFNFLIFAYFFPYPYICRIIYEMCLAISSIKILTEGVLAEEDTNAQNRQLSRQQSRLPLFGAHYGAHFGAQKMIFSRLGIKKAALNAADKPVSDWFILEMEPSGFEPLTPCMPCRCSTS